MAIENLAGFGVERLEAGMGGKRIYDHRRARPEFLLAPRALARSAAWKPAGVLTRIRRPSGIRRDSGSGVSKQGCAARINKTIITFADDFESDGGGGPSLRQAAFGRSKRNWPIRNGEVDITGHLLPNHGGFE